MLIVTVLGLLLVSLAGYAFRGPLVAAFSQMGETGETVKVFEVVVWSAPETRETLTSLRDLLIDTPAGGQVEVSLKKQPASSSGQTFLLTVSDTGMGIPQNEQHKIFQKFGRASNAQSYKTDGTGLGLYIAKQAVGLLGGKIWFFSAENKGTTFFVELPLQSRSIKGTKQLI